MAMSARLLLLAVCVLLSAGMAAAQGVCSLQNVQGTYVNTVSIYAGTVPMVSLGLTRIDATGHWVGPVTLITPAGPVELPSEGEIEVNPDCTALITQHAGGYDHQWAALILHNGEEIRSLHSDPEPEPLPTGPTPTVRVQTLIRLNAGPHVVGNCSEGKLAGRYAQTCTGWIRTGPGIYLPTGLIATMTVDGEGTGSGGGILVFNGQKIPFIYEDLDFSVDPTCRGSASFRIGDKSYGERFVVFDEGKQVISVTLSADQIDTCRFVRMDK